MRGDGGATRIAATARARRARCAAHRACVPGSPSSLASRSASEEAGRWFVPASRSSRARTSRAARRRKRASGERATRPASAKRTTPKMRKDRGANCQAPSQEAARNRTTTASAKTSGGHARSTISARRASLDSEPSRALPSPSAPIGGFSELLTAMPSTAVGETGSKQILGRQASPTALPESFYASTVTLTKAEVCRGRSIPQKSAAAGRPRTPRPSPAPPGPRGGNCRFPPARRRKRPRSSPQ